MYLCMSLCVCVYVCVCVCVCGVCSVSVCVLGMEGLKLHEFCYPKYFTVLVNFVIQVIKKVWPFTLSLT